jgi:hypothetical protein
MSGDPFLITGPALISFSGGRTSAYMLWRILQAHGGTLPDDVHVCFANTGKEREETLRFVHECSVRWGVRVRWLEWRSRLKRTPVAERFEEVGFNSAARDGEPFAALIDSKKALPNQEHRWCSEHLKVQVMHNFMENEGYAEFVEMIGLRADENWRVIKMLARNEIEGRNCRAPLASARVTVRDVMAFWSEQPFDLGLRPVDGNCTLCFMKGRKNIGSLIREKPELADWWLAQEARTGATFSSRHSVAEIVRSVETQPTFEGFDEFDAECGLWCAGEAA